MFANLLLLFVTLTAIAVFLKGFLVTRQNVKTESFYSVDNGYSDGAVPTKLYVMIVDGLRFDFLTRMPDELVCDDLKQSGGMPYNCFEHLHELMRNNASQTELFGFVADPPTTTSQRIKSIVTGTLPSFADMTGNFGGSAGSSSLVGDDILSLLREHSSRSMLFLGDDTWESLFQPSSSSSFCENENDHCRVLHGQDKGDCNCDCSSPPPADEAVFMESFNTKDLHGVDRRIRAELVRRYGESFLDSTEAGRPESGSSNMAVQGSANLHDITLLHFLGVDHIGHTYSSKHHSMFDKLKEMDTLASSVISLLQSQHVQSDGKENSLFLLFGDHGKHFYVFRYPMSYYICVSLSNVVLYMCFAIQYHCCLGMTVEGEHGGSSEDELNSGMFAYSTSSTGTVGPHAKTKPRMVSQLDLAPTLASMFNVPTPSQSIGRIIPELLLLGRGLQQTDSNSARVVLKVLHSNLLQVWNFLQSYYRADRAVQTNFPAELRALTVEYFPVELRALTVEYFPAELRALTVEFEVCLNRYRQLEDVWQTETADEATVATLTQQHLRLLENVQTFARSAWNAFDLRLLTCGVLLLVVGTLGGIYTVYGQLTVYASASVPAADGKRTVLNSAVCIGGVGLVCLHAASCFSNSFIMAEGQVVQYITLTLAWAIALALWQSESRAVYDSSGNKSVDIVRAVGGLAAPLCTYLLVVARPGTRLGRLGLVSIMLLPYLFLGGVVLTVGTRVRDKLPTPAANNRHPAVPVVELIIVMLCVALCLLLFVSGLLAFRMNAHMASWLALGLIATVCLLLFPVLLSVEILAKDAEVWVLGLLVPVVMLQTLVVAARGGPGVLLRALLCVCGCVAFLWTCRQLVQRQAIRRITALSAYALYVYYFACHCLYFATGHAFTFNALQLGAGFLLSDTFEFYQAGALVAYNTFACEVLAFCLVAIGVVALNPTPSIKDIPSILWFGIVTPRLIHVCCAVLGAAMHRHHLMMWAIFAPKLIFAVVFYIVDSILYTISAFIF